MDYTASKFESDLKNVTAFYSDPKAALSMLFKNFDSKMKRLVTSKYKLGVGKYTYEFVGGNKLFVHYPILNKLGTDEDSFWNLVEKEISSDAIDLIDDTHMDNFWEYEGIKEGKGGAVDILLALK